MSSSGKRRTSLMLLLLLLYSFFFNCEAKKVSGDFQLSGSNTEKVLAKFALSAHARGWFNVKFGSKNEMYENERYLRIHVFMDDQWSQWQRAALCTDKVKLKESESKVVFDYKQDEGWVATVAMKLGSETTDQPHYWYIVLDDCSLESYSHEHSKVPRLHYELNVWNDIGGSVILPGTDRDGSPGEKRIKLTHLSADEVGQVQLHVFQLIVGVVISTGMCWAIFSTLVETKSVHAALFWVALAAATDAGSSLFELVHLKWYQADGVGWYFFDAMSAHLEAICDSLVALLLLSVASGWTLPNDVVLQGSAGGTPVAILVQGFRNPIGGLATLAPSSMLGITVIFLHAFLAQWGRLYNDDFSSYHDLEHTPGQLLMALRLFLGILFVVCIHQTRSHCPLSLQSFYQRLGWVGMIWFWSLPLVTWICTLVLPHHWKHPAVSISGCILQTTSLVLLSWLVASESKGGASSSFHKVSRMNPNRENELTDALGGGGGSSLGTSGGPGGPTPSNGSTQKVMPTTMWLGKAKVRLD